ncbi:MAG: NfeD family protein [Clostridia bacterium]|nr:NfeD family protein [Clostridia bacterium]
MDYMIWVWVGILVLSAIIEFATVEMVAIWFSVGAIVGLICALFSAPIWLQIVLFVVVSAALMLFLRTISLKWLLRNAKEKTNIDVLIGQKIKLITAVTEDEFGSAKHNDVVWTVAGEDGFTAEAGEYVKVVEIKGNKLIVSKGDK